MMFENERSFDVSSESRVLLIDDDRDIAKAIQLVLARARLVMDHAETPAHAYAMLTTNHYQAIVLDLNFSRGQTQGEEGLACLSRILDGDPDAKVIVLTAHSGIRIAVAAMRAGAFDFVMKPWRNAELVERINVAIANRRDRAEIANQRGQVSHRESTQLIGDSPAIERVRTVIRRVAPTAASVLISGRMGSGRRRAARSIHASSMLAETDFVELDARMVAATDDQGVESMLRRSSGGTLFLYEVDRLDELGQARLLSRLPADARLISSVEQVGTLTQATRSRLATIEIMMPSLANRGADVMVLAHHFALVAGQKYGRSVAGFTAEAERIILTLGWTSEVLGLERGIERAILLGDGGLIDAADLGLSTVPDDDGGTLTGSTLRASERALVEAVLKMHGFNVARAADELGVSRAALYRRMAKYGL